MPDRFCDRYGVRVFECAADGAHPRNDRDVVELIAAAGEHDAKLVVIPAERLGDNFFHLKTRIAGEILQK
jgi:hypothetical protein